MDLQDQDIYSVSRLNQEARLLLESSFNNVWIMGEISNLVRPSSGHYYFSLKDENAQVRCAFFKNSHRRLNFNLENGQHVLARANVSLYEPRGDYQLIVQEVQLTGDGLLQMAFEKLKAKLQAEGLFSEENKKPIPELPECIGVVTSPTGAAIRDILTVLRRRFPSIPVIIYPCLVQGDLAAAQIKQMIEIANQRQECDVLIVGRGGGSLEDLWPFNEEIVARAIFKSAIPIITGIGHEIDFTIADFVADYRAATPSAAAEAASPDCRRWQQLFAKAQSEIGKIIQNYLQHFAKEIHHLAKRLRHPGQYLREKIQRIDRLEINLIQAFNNYQHRAVTKLDLLHHRLINNSPTKKIETEKQKLLYQSQILQNTLEKKLAEKKQQLTNFSSALAALSPLKTLERGYSILTDSENKIINQIEQVTAGDEISARLSNGKVQCKVLKNHSE